jgi:hypothetical protein
MSFSETNGNLLTPLNLTNKDITISIPDQTQLKQQNNIDNYVGIVSVPMTKSINSVNNEQVVTAFNVGSSLSPITLTGGYATISIPVPGQTIGNWVNIYYSPDNGVSWYFETTAQTISKDGDAYTDFTTNHLGYFAVTNHPDESNS